MSHVQRSKVQGGAKAAAVRSLSQSWISQRSALMHDWLSAKHFLGKLAGVTRALRGEIDRSDLSAGCILAMCKEWRDKRAAALWLVDNFAAAMSPATLLDAWPLSALPEHDSRTIAALVHQLWLDRTDVAQLVEAAREAIALVDGDVASLERVLKVRMVDAGRHPAGDKETPGLVEKLYLDTRLLHSRLAAYPSRVHTT